MEGTTVLAYLLGLPKARAYPTKSSVNMTSRKHLVIEVELKFRNGRPINKPWRINICWWMINWHVGSYSGLPARSLTVSGSSPFLLLHIPANLDNDNATSSGWITGRQTRQHAIAFRVPCTVLLQGFTTERFKTLKHRPVVVYPIYWETTGNVTRRRRAK